LPPEGPSPGKNSRRRSTPTNTNLGLENRLRDGSSRTSDSPSGSQRESSSFSEAEASETAAERVVVALSSFPAFLNHVKTYDREGRVQPMPVNWDFVQRVAAAIERHRLVAILKSRQMLVSWISAAYSVYSGLKWPRTVTLIASKGQLEANENKDKAAFVYWNLPEWLRLPVLKDITGLMLWENKSRVLSVPASAGVGRSFTTGTVIMDEAAHAFYGADMWRGLAPTLDSEGKAIVVSTPNGHDRLFYPIWHRDPPMFHRLTVHWREHPFRDDAWADQVRAQIVETGEDWEQEYELNFHAHVGTVFPEFNRIPERPNIVSPFEVPAWWTRVVGVDHGLRGFGAAWLAHEPGKRRIFYQDYLGNDRSLPENLEAIKALSRGQDIAAWPTDPSVTGRDWWRQSRYIDEFQRLHGLEVEKADNNVSIGLNRMRAAMTVCEDGIPLLRVMNTCPALIQALRELSWEQVQRRRKPHVADAARYAWMAESVPGSVRPDDSFLPDLLPLPPEIDAGLDPMSRSVYVDRWMAKQRAEESGGLW